MFRYALITLLLLCTSGPIAFANPGTDNETILVIGATGRTGRLVVEQLAQRGIKHIAGVRDLEKGREILGKKTPLVKLDVTDLDTLISATKNITGIINTASTNARTATEAIVKKVELNGNANIAKAAKSNGVKRVVLVSSLGATHKDHFLNKVANNVLLWKFEGEKALRASGVDYTIVRPGGLKDGPSGKMSIRFMQGDLKENSGFIPRSDVATICIEALISPHASRKTFEAVVKEGPATKDFHSAFKKLSSD